MTKEKVLEAWANVQEPDSVKNCYMEYGKDIVIDGITFLLPSYWQRRLPMKIWSKMPV